MASAESANNSERLVHLGESGASNAALRFRSSMCPDYPARMQPLSTGYKNNAAAATAIGVTITLPAIAAALQSSIGSDGGNPASNRSYRVEDRQKHQLPNLGSHARHYHPNPPAIPASARARLADSSSESSFNSYSSTSLTGRSTGSGAGSASAGASASSSNVRWSQLRAVDAMFTTKDKADSKGVNDDGIANRPTLHGAPRGYFLSNDLPGRFVQRYLQSDQKTSNPVTNANGDHRSTTDSAQNENGGENNSLKDEDDADEQLDPLAAFVASSLSPSMLLASDRHGTEMAHFAIYKTLASIFKNRGDAIEVIQNDLAPPKRKPHPQTSLYHINNDAETSNDGKHASTNDHTFVLATGERIFKPDQNRAQPPLDGDHPLTAEEVYAIPTADVPLFQRKPPTGHQRDGSIESATSTSTSNPTHHRLHLHPAEGGHHRMQSTGTASSSSLRLPASDSCSLSPSRSLASLAPPLSNSSSSASLVSANSLQNPVALAHSISSASVLSSDSFASGMTSSSTLSSLLSEPSKRRRRRKQKQRNNIRMEAPPLPFKPIYFRPDWGEGREANYLPLPQLYGKQPKFLTDKSSPLFPNEVAAADEIEKQKREFTIRDSKEGLTPPAPAKPLVSLISSIAASPLISFASSETHSVSIDGEKKEELDKNETNEQPASHPPPSIGLGRNRFRSIAVRVIMQKHGEHSHHSFPSTPVSGMMTSRTINGEGDGESTPHTIPTTPNSVTTSLLNTPVISRAPSLHSQESVPLFLSRANSQWDFRKVVSAAKLLLTKDSTQRKRIEAKMLNFSANITAESWMKSRFKLRKKHLDAEEKRRAKEMFTMLDLDGNKSIEIEELRRAMRSLGLEITNDELQLRIERMDMNKDHTLSFDEFVSAFHSHNDWESLYESRERHLEREREKDRNRARRDRMRLLMKKVQLAVIARRKSLDAENEAARDTAMKRWEGKLRKKAASSMEDEHLRRHSEYDSGGGTKTPASSLTRGASTLDQPQPEANLQIESEKSGEEQLRDIKIKVSERISLKTPAKNTDLEIQQTIAENAKNKTSHDEKEQSSDKMNDEKNGQGEPNAGDGEGVGEDEGDGSIFRSELPFHLWVPAYGRRRMIDEMIAARDREKRKEESNRTSFNRLLNTDDSAERRKWKHVDLSEEKDLIMTVAAANDKRKPPAAEKSEEKKSATPWGGLRRVKASKLRSPTVGPVTTQSPITHTKRSSVYWGASQVLNALQLQEKERHQQHDVLIPTDDSINETAPLSPRASKDGDTEKIAVGEEDVETPISPRGIHNGDNNSGYGSDGGRGGKFRNRGKKEVMAAGDPLLKAAKSSKWQQLLVLIQQHSGSREEQRNFVNRRDKNGSTILHAIAWTGHLRCLEIALAHQADVNVANNRGNLPLHLASEKYHLPVIALMITYGANINHVNAYGKRCWEMFHQPTVEDDKSKTIPAASLTPTATSMPATSHTTETVPAPTEASPAAKGKREKLREFVQSCHDRTHTGDGRDGRLDAPKAIGDGLGLASVAELHPIEAPLEDQRAIVYAPHSFHTRRRTSLIEHASMRVAARQAQSGHTQNAGLASTDTSAATDLMTFAKQRTSDAQSLASVLATLTGSHHGKKLKNNNSNNDGIHSDSNGNNNTNTARVGEAERDLRNKLSTYSLSALWRWTRDEVMARRDRDELERIMKLKVAERKEAEKVKTKKKNKISKHVNFDFNHADQ